MKTQTKKPKKVKKTNAQRKIGGELMKVVKAKKGHWEIRRSVSGLNFFNTGLIAKNGKLICANHGFNTVASAKKNIKSVQASA